MDAPYSVNFDERKGSVSDNMFVSRWSPRAFEKTEISKETMEKIMDAARFAPSAFNAQPWRIFASSGPEDFDTFLELLIERNQTWAKNAGSIGFMIAKNNFDHNDSNNNWAVYDCGFAWASLTFQANKLGFYTHGMAGIKVDAIYEKFNIPRDKYTVVAGFAIGKITSPEGLPDVLKEREFPSPRKDLNEIYFPGGTNLS